MIKYKLIFIKIKISYIIVILKLMNINQIFLIIEIKYQLNKSHYIFYEI